MRKTVRGGGNGNARTLAEHSNGNARTQNDSREWKWALRGGGMGEHGMAAYLLSP
jgi:hypothetical protein